MTKENAVGAAQIAGGGILAYKGIEHGLPRALGIRTEYHTTTKTNANLIKKAGNYLDPAFGGQNGMSKAVQNARYIENSKNFVHITGLHESNTNLKTICGTDNKGIKEAVKTLYRKAQCQMYKSVGRRTEKTKRFCIPGIDSWFNSEFISDADDIALKSAKKVKCFNNRFSAMIGGLKKFGLKGMKENKGRVAAGAAMLALGLAAGGILIKNGIDKIKNKKEDNADNE